MKVLILHLSDIHIMSENDPVLNRVDQLIAAIRNIDYDIATSFIVVSGDLAFSGKDEQYVIAIDYLGRIREELQKVFVKSVHLVLVPGNHDCDFGGSQTLREVLIDAIAQKPTFANDLKAVEVCTTVQKSFFSIRDMFNENGLTDNNTIYYEYSFTIGNEHIVFRCCNTAWLSQLHEKPGSLRYPVDLIRDQASPTDLVVTVFHHPYNWLVPENARSFRKRVEEVADVILTGHEHDYTLREQRGEKGEVNLYIEGGALQESHRSEASAFNAILIDTTQKRQKVIHFEWRKELYIQTQPSRDWEDYQINRLRNQHGYQINERFNKYLDDLGLTLLHPVCGPLSLSQVFVYPDLREITYKPREIPQSVRGEVIVGLLDEVERLLITGVDKSGKTSLAKRLFRDFLSNGFVPLFLDGSTLRSLDGDRCDKEFERNFEEQYSAHKVDHYMQLDRSRRVLIVDNYHKLRYHKASLDRVLEYMTNFARQVVLFSNDLAHQVSEIVGTKPITEGRKPFIHYRIQQYGHVRRDELIERWFLLDPNAMQDKEAFIRKLIEVKNVINTAIGKSFVPPYPVTILTILQAHHHSEQINLNASTYGYFYELLIKRALASESTTQLLDVKLGYLTFLAYQLFNRKVSEVFEHDLLEIHKSYEEYYSIRVSFTGVMKSFIDSMILEKGPDSFKFKYKYIYYYFVARYLSSHITEEDVRAHIVMLSNELHVEENANILLFLAHLSKDPFIIQQMLRSAAEVFSNSPREELRIKDSLLDVVDKTLTEITYIERHPAEVRREVAAKLDSYEEERARREEFEQKLEETDQYFKQISVAFRTLQILGQILKNFPGSMSGVDKRKITEECYSIGLRTLGSLFTTVKENSDEVVQTIINNLRTDDPNLTDDELSKKARESLYGIIYMASFSIVKRISSAVGSPHLVQVYDAILKDDDAPAVALVSTSLKLDQFSEFPEQAINDLKKQIYSNPLAFRVLRSLVVNHFHMFDLPYDQKQRVCAELDISYKPLHAVNPNMKLIKKS